ncbi:hypothetical protein FQZ97_950590 [compost metagenome]
MTTRPPPRRCWPSGRPCSPSASTWSCSAPRAPTTKSTCMPRSPWPTVAARRWWPPTMCASSSRVTSRPTRPASVSARAGSSVTHAVRAPIPTSSTSSPPRKWRTCSATFPRRWRTPSRSPSVATLTCSLASTFCRTFRRPMAWASTTTCVTFPTRVSKSAWRCSGRRRPRRTTRKSARSTWTA